MPPPSPASNSHVIHVPDANGLVEYRTMFRLVAKASGLSTDSRLRIASVIIHETGVSPGNVAMVEEASTQGTEVVVGILANSQNASTLVTQAMAPLLKNASVADMFGISIQAMPLLRQMTIVHRPGAGRTTYPPSSAPALPPHATATAASGCSGSMAAAAGGETIAARDCSPVPPMPPPNPPKLVLATFTEIVTIVLVAICVVVVVCLLFRCCIRRMRVAPTSQRVVKLGAMRCMAGTPSIETFAPHSWLFHDPCHATTRQ